MFNSPLYWVYFSLSNDPISLFLHRLRKWAIVLMSALQYDSFSSNNPTIAFPSFSYLSLLCIPIAQHNQEAFPLSFHQSYMQFGDRHSSPSAILIGEDCNPCMPSTKPCDFCYPLHSNQSPSPTTVYQFSRVPIPIEAIWVLADQILHLLNIFVLAAICSLKPLIFSTHLLKRFNPNGMHSLFFLSFLRSLRDYVIQQKITLLPKAPVNVKPFASYWLTCVNEMDMGRIGIFPLQHRRDCQFRERPLHLWFVKWQCSDHSIIIAASTTNLSCFQWSNAWAVSSASNSRSEAGMVSSRSWTTSPCRTRNPATAVSWLKVCEYQYH